MFFSWNTAYTELQIKCGDLFDYLTSSSLCGSLQAGTV